MTAKPDDRKSRMTAAASVRTAPDAPPAGTTAIRTKPYRITLDLAPDDYASLNRWLTLASLAVNPDDPRRLSLAKALRAMIHATTGDTAATGVVLNLLRADTAAGQ